MEREYRGVPIAGHYADLGQPGPVVMFAALALLTGGAIAALLSA